MSDIGREFEEQWSKRIGGRVQPGSGNQWFARMDVDQSSILWSCKATGKESYRLSGKDLDEVTDAVDAPGGKGGETIPAMALKIGEDREVVVLRADDFLALLQEKVKLFTPDKATQKRELSKLPQLFRSTS